MKKTKPFVANAIREARKEKNLTQKELANMIGKSEISIRKYEAGDALPPYSVISQIAQALEKSIYEMTDMQVGCYGRETTNYYEFVDKEYSEIEKYMDARFDVLSFYEIWTPDDIEIVLLRDEIISNRYSKMQLIDDVSKIKRELKKEFEEKLKKAINEHLEKIVLDKKHY